jgi:hypothetical protein
MPVRFLYHRETPKQDLQASEIDACGEYLQVAIPPDLRKFLLDHAGPMPEPPWIRIAGPGEPRWLGPMLTFFTVMQISDPRSRRDTIESYTYASRDLNKLPNHYLCIGIVLRQPSTLLMSTAESDFGTLYAWHVEFRRRFDLSHTIRVADGLSALLDAFDQVPASEAATYPNWEQDLQRARTQPVYPTD